MDQDYKIPLLSLNGTTNQMYLLKYKFPQHCFVLHLSIRAQWTLPYTLHDPWTATRNLCSSLGQPNALKSRQQKTGKKKQACVMA